jgi:hypothetical protein
MTQSIFAYSIAPYSVSSVLLIGAVIISTFLEICSLLQGMINWGCVRTRCWGE